jgi:hypothetical protein
MRSTYEADELSNIICRFELWKVPTTGISVANHSYDTVHEAPESET